MNIEEFVAFDNFDKPLEIVSLKITRQVFDWFTHQFKETLEQNENYPINGFKLIHKNKDGGNRIVFSYGFKYGTLHCDIGLTNKENLFNFYTLTIDQDIINNNGFYNQEFDVYFDNNFKMDEIVNTMKNSNLDNDIQISTSIRTNNDKREKIIFLYKVGIDHFESKIDKENDFFIDFHYIIEKIYKGVLKNELKDINFPEYPEMQSKESFKEIIKLYTDEYEFKYEELQRKILNLKMLDI